MLEIELERAIGIVILRVQLLVSLCGSLCVFNSMYCHFVFVHE